MDSPLSPWQYGQVTSNALNVRREPSRQARRWNNVLPMNRIILIKSCPIPGWYESRYRGELAYVMADFITPLSTIVPQNIVERMLYMAVPEKGRSNSVYFNGYGGKWCHRFADWLAMNAGMPNTYIPNTSNCGKGIVWFATNSASGGFFFQNPEHKLRMIRAYNQLNHIAQELTADESDYRPSPGDYVYFRWRNASSTINVSHVGIVAEIGNTSITTWEGNAGRKVAQRTYALDSDEIVGYGHPVYPQQ